MASPISVGDALALARLAIVLGRAFTKGKVSAPTEFRDIESQLYSLSAALDSLVSMIPNTTPRATNIEAQFFQPTTGGGRAEDENYDTLSHAIRSCEVTVKHLESVVSQYAILKRRHGDRDGDQPTMARFKRWNDNVKFAWKSVKWTTEGGDLMTLRSNLMVHTNSLNLLLGVKLNTRIDQIHLILKEIHQWRNESLQPQAGPSSRLEVAGQSSAMSVSQPTFALDEASENQRLPICSHAFFLTHRHPGEPLQPEAESIFGCSCPLAASDTEAPHAQRLRTYGFSPLTFCMRVAGSQRVFILYKATNRNTTSLTTLLAEATTLQGMRELEEYLCVLAIRLARSFFRRNLNTMLCYLTTEGPDGGPLTASRAHILNLTGDATTVQQRIKSVTFYDQHLSFHHDAIDTIQLLHYKRMDLGRLMEGTFVPEEAVHYEPSAEVVILYRNLSADGQTTDGDVILRTTLHLMHNTRVTCNNGGSTITFTRVDCTSFCADEKAHIKRGVQAVFQYDHSDAAVEFHGKIEQMKLELFVIHLKYPRPSEAVLLKVLAKDVHTESFHIADAGITILRNTESQRMRLLIVDASGHTIVSQELAENFVPPVWGGPARLLSFRSQTYVVRMDDRGSRRILSYENGFAHLGFSDAKIDRLFQIGLAAIAGITQVLPDRNIRE